MSLTAATERPETATAKRLVDDLESEALRSARDAWFLKVRDVKASKPILQSSGPLRHELIHEIIVRTIGHARGSAANSMHYFLARVCSELLRKGTVLSEDEVVHLIEHAGPLVDWTWFSAVPVGALLTQLERRAGEQPLTDREKESLDELRELMRGWRGTAEVRKCVGRIELLQKGSEAVVPLLPGDEWTDRAIAFVEGLPVSARDGWSDLLEHSRTATGSKPSARWLKHGRELIDSIGPVETRESLLEWFPLVRKPVDAGTGAHYRARPLFFREENSDVMKGLLWVAAVIADDALVRTIGDVAERCLKKMPNVGAVSAKMGNAAIVALSHCEEREAIAQLTRFAGSVKYTAGKRLIDTALTTAAERLGMTREDLEELAAPEMGLTSVGRLDRAIGDFHGHLEVQPNGEVTLVWIRPDGRRQASPPKELRENYGKQLKAITQLKKDLPKNLASQRRRIEANLRYERELPFADWKRRYLDHRLVGHLARRLIWNFEVSDGRLVSGLWWNDAIREVGGGPLSDLDGSSVRLWHPLGVPVEEVLGWRRRIESLDMTQPFRQAHREIYVLTGAERKTATYSNRFGAHILQQHQFAALCRDRGWRYTLQGDWDSFNTPCLDLSRHDLTVELWVEPVPDDAEEAADSGVYRYVATDQVRFVRNGEPLALDTVPPRLFSEVLRDVDLFVGVSSIGNDPTWIASGGETGRDRFDDYWRAFAFGPLMPSAETRRDVMTRILPRLKIAARCELRERFLVVRGDLRTYRIHLGSGNVMMEPNDQYLCIVPDRITGARSKDAPMLPFEGDTLLSIILSKALMLADDGKIQDASIREQIVGGS